MLKIRFANPNDVATIVELGRGFLKAGPYRDVVKDNPERAEEFARELIARLNARILLAEEDGATVGVLAFVVFGHYLSGELTANEIIWYVVPSHRGRAALELLWAAEREAAKLGAVNMQLTAPDAHAGRIYKRLGYQTVEVGYQASLRERTAYAGD